MNDKVVLITGSSSGIGEGIAKHMAKIGYKRIALLARREDRLQEVREDLLALGATAVLVLKADLTVPEECDQAIQEIKTTFGRLDVLVNNAGDYDGIAKIKDLSLEKFKHIIDVNLTSHLIVLHGGSGVSVVGVGKAGRVRISRQCLKPHGSRTNSYATDMRRRDGFRTFLDWGSDCGFNPPVNVPWCDSVVVGTIWC